MARRDTRPLVLASRSPQRRAILEQLGISFEVRPAEVEERAVGPAEEVVTYNALQKARLIAGEVGPERLVLGVDTVVALDGRLYGKARDVDEARSHLAQLSGHDHHVWSALALIESGRERIGTARTTVRFRQLDRQMVDWYVTSEEWRGRAGAYAIQEKGAVLIEEIHGDYLNVVGLPAALLLQIAPQLLGVPRST